MINKDRITPKCPFPLVQAQEDRAQWSPLRQLVGLDLVPAPLPRAADESCSSWTSQEAAS